MLHHGDIASSVATSQFQSPGFNPDLRFQVCAELCLFSPYLFGVLWFLPTVEQHAKLTSGSKLPLDV